LTADVGFYLAGGPTGALFTNWGGQGSGSTLSTSGFINLESGTLRVGTTDNGRNDYGTLNIGGTGGFNWDGGTITFSYSTTTSTVSDIVMGATTTGGFTVNQNRPSTCFMGLQIIGNALNPSPLTVVDNTAGTGTTVNPAPGDYSGAVVGGNRYVVTANPGPQAAAPAWGRWSLDPALVEVLARKTAG
jgi:hypothetical protein